MTANYKVYYLDLPEDVRSVSGLFDDGSYIIGINQALSDHDKEKTLRHELAHIRLDHFHDTRPIREIETEAKEAAR